MKNRINKCVVLIAVLCVLVTVFAVPLASAASYSKVYGQTQDKIRVRESASTNAAIIDNIIKGACVYVTSSKESGSTVFIKVNYRAENGDIESGWLCQKDSGKTYVKILSAAQAKDAFNVSGGNLPSKRVGTFTASQRNTVSSSSSSSSYISLGSTGSTVKSIQTKLKYLGYYTGELTGNAGEKTVAAIKKFQKAYSLTADGVAGPMTIAKIDAVYSEKGGSSSSSSSSSSGLKLGSKGSDVSELQSDLTTLGYYWAEITGNFGSKTEDAVIRFQKAKGLSADGVAGSKTIAAIASALAAGGHSSSSSSSSSTGSTLKLNSQGDAVSDLQENLKALGYYYAEITGNFGSKTEAAVKAYQKANGLTADGIAGKKTLEAIADDVGYTGSSSSGSGMKLGSTGTKVSALQQDLTTLGFYYGDITGHYGNLTKQAVTKFQKSRGLTQDGIAGSSTIKAIESALGGNGSLGSSSSSGTSLKEGDSGSAVEDLQTRLKKLEYYYGDITGNFGSLTKRAVRKFQDDNDLTVDGIAGAKTLNKLYSLTGGGTVSSSGSVGTVVDTDDSYGQLIKDNVNLRKSYSTSSAAITTLDEGDLIRITKKYNISGMVWYYVTAKEGGYTYKGYIRSDMIELITEAEYNAGGGDIDTGDAEILGMIRITADKVNMRTEPDSDSDSVGYAYEDDVFYYVDTVDSWFQTKSGYWIKSTYAEVMTDDEIEDYVDSGSSSGGTYREGDTGSMVKWIQEALKALDFYDGELSGHYGSKTKEAVRQFQRDNDISADGVAGPKTIAKLEEEYAEFVGGSSSGGTTDVDYNAKIYSINWFTHQSHFYRSSAYMNLGNGKTATLTDVQTGKSFKIKVQTSGGNHADVEPLTEEDTDVLCSLYGVSTAEQLVSKDKYKRRAVVVTSANGNYQAIGSIYAIPHGTNTIKDNDFDGQFCLHFKGSKTHGGSSGNVKVDPDHKEQIEAAEEYLDGRKNANDVEITVVTECPYSGC